MTIVAVCPDHKDDVRIYGIDSTIAVAKNCIDCINLNAALGVDLYDLGAND